MWVLLVGWVWVLLAGSCFEARKLRNQAGCPSQSPDATRSTRGPHTGDLGAWARGLKNSFTMSLVAALMPSALPVLGTVPRKPQRTSKLSLEHVNRMSTLFFRSSRWSTVTSPGLLKNSRSFCFKTPEKADSDLESYS